MKSMILGGILVQPYGINCDAKILDTILRKEMIISVEKKKTSRIRCQLSVINPLETSYIKANRLKRKGWKQICSCCCLDAQLCPTLLRPLWNQSRQDSWSGLPCSPPGTIPTQGSKPCLCMSYISGDSSLLRQQICYGNTNLKKT